MRVSLQTLKLLQVFMEDPAEPRYGLLLMGRTGLKSGTIYPALHRLESEGWLRSWSEDVDSSEVGRPARRLHRHGRALAGASDADAFQTTRGPPGRAPARSGRG